MAKTVLLIGAFDSKGAEYDFVRQRLQAAGLDTLTLNWGVLGGCEQFPVDIDAAKVAAAGGGDLEALREAGDHDAAVAVMAKGAAALVPTLYHEGRFDGVFALGKARGTSVAAAAMRALPLGVAKVIVSTLAGSDTSAFLGAKDINIFPSVVDVSGLNAISRTILAQAAAALAGMVAAEPLRETDAKPIIAMSMFGQTRPCVERCKAALVEAGYDVLVFHATGSGGRTMESMIEDGAIAAVLDVTTTELADELCGGVFSAGPQRLEAAGKAGIPQVIVPGCLDMVNFGAPDTVPAAYRARQLHAGKPTVTLMRTDIEENRQLGQILAEKANAAQGPVVLLVPAKGWSRFDAEDGPFWCPEADHAAIEVLRANLRPDVPLIEIPAHINDEAFATAAVKTLLAML
jgi:uncharacterized protein (UPF0261 family)